MKVEVTIVLLAGSTLHALALASMPDLPGPIQLKACAITDENARCEYILRHEAILRLAQRANGGRVVSLTHASSGRPQLACGPHVSVSRTSGYAAVALCQTHDIGVDIVSAVSDLDWSIASRYPGLAGRLRPSGRRAKSEILRAWTELEALAKLWQQPMQRLLDGHLPPPAAVVSLSGGGLTLTLATPYEAVVELAFARWTDSGNLLSTPFLQTLSAFEGGKVVDLTGFLSVKTNCHLGAPLLNAGVVPRVHRLSN